MNSQQIWYYQYLINYYNQEIKNLLNHIYNMRSQKNDYAYLENARTLQINMMFKRKQEIKKILHDAQTQRNEISK